MLTPRSLKVGKTETPLRIEGPHIALRPAARAGPPATLISTSVATSAANPSGSARNPLIPPPLMPPSLPSRFAPDAASATCTLVALGLVALSPARLCHD